jgi:hypothetical protein
MYYEGQLHLISVAIVSDVKTAIQCSVCFLIGLIDF